MKKSLIISLILLLSFAASGQSQNKINGHEYVDLGLSVKWATCNLGANTPSDYGNYYAWGETLPKKEYTEENSVAYGKNLGYIAGNVKYDAVLANWGSTWRLPTAGDWYELFENSTWRCIELDGHFGFLITGPNGNSIFLPAAGWIDGVTFHDVGAAENDVLYWSATQIEEARGFVAYCCGFESQRPVFEGGALEDGYPIRPVSE